MICDGWQIPIQSEVRTDLKQAEGNFLPISLFISHDWRASTSSMFQSVDWYQAITHIKSDNGITSPWLGQSKIHIPWGTDTTSTTTTTSVTLEAEMQQTKHGVDFAATKSHKRDQTNDQKTFPKPNENIQIKQTHQPHQLQISCAKKECLHNFAEWQHGQHGHLQSLVSSMAWPRAHPGGG